MKKNDWSGFSWNRFNLDTCMHAYTNNETLNIHANLNKSATPNTNQLYFQWLNVQIHVRITLQKC
jgi:hypothetical protein